MERAETEREIEEAEELEEEIEGLQARRSMKSNDTDSNYKQKNVDINSGFVVDDVAASEQLKINGGIDVSEAPESNEHVVDICVSYHNAQGTGYSNCLSSNGHVGIKYTAPENINQVDVTIKSLNITQFLSQERELEHGSLSDSSPLPSEISPEKDKPSLNVTQCLSQDSELEHGSLSDSIPILSEISPEEDKTSLNISSYKAVQSPDTDLPYVSDHEATELDVERVLRKQDTHDLFCPNCNSCITKRVIIRKRKRRLPNLGEDGKRNKLENLSGPDPISTSVPTTSSPSHNTVDTCVDSSGAPASNNIVQDQEPDVFRCLSCFSIFIPTGNGFKLFRMFGDRSDKDNLQDPPERSKKSWFSTLSLSKKRVSSSADVETDDTEVLVPSNSMSQQDGSVSSVQESSSQAQTDLNGESVNSRIKESMEGVSNILSPQEISLAKPGSLDNFEDQVSMNLNKENGETLPDKSPSNAIYADGESVWSEISGSKEGGNNVLSTTYCEELLNHEGEHQGITLAGIPPTTSREAAEISTFKPQENGLKFFIPPDVSSFTAVTSKTDQNVNGTIPKRSSDEKETAFLLHTPLLFLEESYMDSEEKITSNISQNEQNSGASHLFKFATQTKNGEVITNDEEKIHHSDGYQRNNTYEAEVSTDEPYKTDQSVPVPIIQNTLLLQERQISLRNTLKDTDAQRSSVSDTIIVENSHMEEPDDQRDQDLINPAESGNLQHLETRIQINEQRGLSTEGLQGSEIIKSIVYGGLVESITSLGVVSSAAGSDATTLNVLALGLATLIGGLIIIGHNLWELKNDKKTEASDQLDERVDRYHELLGHRRNFLLHAVFAILSFLTFGLIPPVTYGFSFRKSDDRNLKLVTVAAASLLAIILLASGKAYVKRAPKSYVKTVLYYVIMGLMVSGISYEVGNLIIMFLEKLGIFQSSLVVTLPGTGLMKPAWASS